LNLKKNNSAIKGGSNSPRRTLCGMLSAAQVDKTKFFYRCFVRDAQRIFYQRAGCPLRKTGRYRQLALTQRDAGEGGHGKGEVNTTQNATI